LYPLLGRKFQSSVPNLGIWVDNEAELERGNEFIKAS
jgi:hypothetical protein